MSVNVLIFANCHGIIYKNALQRADINSELSITHIVSYQNIDNFSNIVSYFQNCDILIIQPVQNYEQFSIHSLREKYLKKSCKIIRVPFIRFEGFWDKTDVRELEKFKPAAVMFYPKVFRKQEIPIYLNGEELLTASVMENFEKSLKDFSDLEKRGDIKFYDFFVQNYQNTPLFRDSYHLTAPFYNYVIQQLIDLVSDYANVKLKRIENVSLIVGREYGHFKPIITKVAESLKLSYDLSSYFKYNRYEYLSMILEHENSQVPTIIADLNELTIFFNNQKSLPSK